MAVPFDHRDVTFSGGGTEVDTNAITHYDTLMLNAYVIKDSRTSMKVVAAQTDFEETHHELRLFPTVGAPDTAFGAKITWRRRAANPGGNVSPGADQRAPAGTFPFALPSAPPDFTDVVNVPNSATLTVDSWVTVTAGFTKTVVNSGGDAAIALLWNGAVVYTARLSAK